MNQSVVLVIKLKINHLEVLRKHPELRILQSCSFIQAQIKKK